MDRKIETLNWKEWRIRGIWWPANSVDRYSSATVTTDVYGGFRCLEERSVDGRWMEDHGRSRSVHRMCWSCMLFVMIVTIWTCTDRRMWCCSSRSLYRQKRKCCTMQFSCRMETSSSLIRWRTTRMCSSSVNSRSMGRSSSGVSILDRLHRLDWMIGCLNIYRSMKMETYSSLTSITTELFCCILDGLMFKYSWTEINIRSNHHRHFVTYERSNSWSSVNRDQEGQQMVFVCSISVHTRHPLTIEHSRVNWTSSSLVHSIMVGWRYATVRTPHLVCQVWCCYSSSQLCHVRSIGITFHPTHHNRMVSHTCFYFLHALQAHGTSLRRGFSNASTGWSCVWTVCCTCRTWIPSRPCETS